MPSLAMDRGQKYKVDRMRHLELALEREHSARIKLERENTELRNQISKFIEQVSASEIELKQARVVSETAVRAKNAFLSTMSHEFRTPLNAIIGYSDLLLDDAEGMGNQRLADDLIMIKGAGKHLLNLIDDTLDVTKIDSGNLVLTLSEIDLPGLVDDVAQTAHPLMEKNNNRFSMVVSPDVGMARCDYIRLRQILMNLLSNAAKFTQSGSVVLSVSLCSREDRSVFLFRISDTGIGMTESELIRVFTDFDQVDNSYSRRYQGVGLGLSIAHKLTRLMGGELLADSKKGEGSCFTVILPV
jgi:signal transduction histidine kinase